MYDILCVTNRRICREDFLVRIEKIAAVTLQTDKLRGRLGIILREKDLDEAEYKRLASEVMRICRKYGVKFIPHSFTDIACELGCDSVHLPLSILRAAPRERLSAFSCIGASCHSAEEAAEAEKLGCTYITAGHIFDTDCKSGIPGRGTEFLREVCESVAVPVYAIGGISPNNAAEVRSCGVSGVCVMSGAMLCDDVYKYFSAFQEFK